MHYLIQQCGDVEPLTVITYKFRRISIDSRAMLPCALQCNCLSLLIAGSTSTALDCFDHNSRRDCLAKEAVEAGMAQHFRRSSYACQLPDDEDGDAIKSSMTT